MKTTYVILVTYNIGPEIGALLDRLVLESQQLKELAVHILLVDNASTDSNTQDLLSEREGNKNFHVIRNEKNRGFAAGCNIGVRYALSHHADAVLLLNPDTEIPVGFFREMLDSRADISAPVIRFQRSGSWIFDYGGTVNMWTGETKHIEAIEQCSNRAIKYEVIDYVSGCCMLIRKNVFDAIGFFDERYFLYFEDVDFCLRAKQAGLGIDIVPSCVVTHALKEGNQKSLAKHRAHLSSALVFINTWIPWYRCPIAYDYWIILVIRTYIRIAIEEIRSIKISL